MPPPNTPRSTSSQHSSSHETLIDAMNGARGFVAQADESLPDTTRNESLSPRTTGSAGLRTSPDPNPSLSTIHDRKAREKVDLRNLDYTTDVDENLMCPVCRLALIEPVTTTCEHVFCKECLQNSYYLSPTCPIDRSPICMPQDVRLTPKIILNLLDGLLVKCPNSPEGCQKVLARSMVQNHVSRYCEFTMVGCPIETCYLDVPRKYVDNRCRHQRSACPDCHQLIWELKLEHHRESECDERLTDCTECGVEVLRYRMKEHEEGCKEISVSCKWVEYGCLYTTKRKYMSSHLSSCDLRFTGPMIEKMKEEITRLCSEVQFLHERDKIKDRRIRFLECSTSAPTDANPDISTLPDAPASADYGPHDSRDQYLLSLLEHQDSKVDQLSAGMTELEAKQTMMLLNETMPIKEQLAELRSAQGTLSMHVRWLLQFRRQESRPSATANSASAGAEAGGNISLAPIRRLSDSTRDNVTKL